MMIESKMLYKYKSLNTHLVKDHPKIRRSGRSTTIILKAITNVYLGLNTDMYFNSYRESHNFVDLCIEQFKILKCPILKIETGSCGIKFKIEIRNRTINFTLRSKSQYNNNVHIYTGNNVTVFIDHRLYWAPKIINF